MSVYSTELIEHQISTHISCKKWAQDLKNIFSPEITNKDRIPIVEKIFEYLKQHACSARKINIFFDELYAHLESPQCSKRNWYLISKKFFEYIESTRLSNQQLTTIFKRLFRHLLSPIIPNQKTKKILRKIFKHLKSSQLSCKKRAPILSELFRYMNSPELSDEYRKWVHKNLQLYLKFPLLKGKERAQILNAILCCKFGEDEFLKTLYDLAENLVGCSGFLPGNIGFEDCVQESIIVLMKRLEEDHIKKNPLAFLRGTIRKKIQCEISKCSDDQKHHVNIDERWDISTPSTEYEEDGESAQKKTEDFPPPKLSLDKKTIKKLKADIDKLPPAVLDFAYMTIIKKMTREQIIQTKGISPEYFRKLRQRLRDSLREMGYDV